ncbi:hypothetical protein [Nocardia sp. NPDC004722]
MSTTKTARYLAIGAVLAAVAIPFSTGTATADSGTDNGPGKVNIWVGGGPDILACEATAQTCNLTAYVYDMSTPVTLRVDGKALATGVPVASSGTAEPGKFVTVWTPQTAGAHVISMQQGSQSTSITVQIMDNNGAEANIKRFEYFLAGLVCNTGSGRTSSVSGSAGCMQTGVH